MFSLIAITNILNKGGPKTDPRETPNKAVYSEEQNHSMLHIACD